MSSFEAEKQNSANDSPPEQMLHLLCGKIAAGKSTLAARLAAQPLTILVSEDEWLSKLYPDKIKSIEDYVRYSACLRNAMKPHVVSLLAEGLSVVLDFPANTYGQRKWLREVFETAGVAHQMHFLDVSDDICKQRLRARNAVGDHAFEASDAEFDLFTSYFVPPSADEEFNIIRHEG
jgi:predicted kinase